MNADLNVKLKPYDPNTLEGFKPQKAYSQILHHTLWLGKRANVENLIHHRLNKFGN